jgi:hypothetical protein
MNAVVSFSIKLQFRGSDSVGPSRSLREHRVEWEWIMGIITDEMPPGRAIQVFFSGAVWNPEMNSLRGDLRIIISLSQRW